MSQPAPAAEVAALNDAIAAKPTATLIDAARRLVEARANAEQLALVYRAKLAEFNERYAWLAEDKKAADALVAAAEIDVKSLARVHYDTTKDKKPITGVEIKMYNTISYDAAAALAWARETKLALTPECLDVKAFEKIAAATPLAFVTKGEEPKVTLGQVIEVPEASTEVALPSTDAELDEIFGGVE